VVWRLDAGLARMCIHHPTQDDQRHGRDHDTGSKQMAAAEPSDGEGSGADCWLRQRSQRMNVGTTQFTRFADLIWC
jgi:hypothetical protein